MEEKLNGGNSQPVDDSFSSSGRFTWKIENFSNPVVGKLYSDIFDAGGYKWRMLIFPKGLKQSDHLSIYLVAADSATLPSGWSRHARFIISVISQIPKFTVAQESEYIFNATKNYWGFLTFMTLSELNDPLKRYLVNGSCTVEAEVMLNEEQIKEEVKKKEPTSDEAGKNSSYFAEFDKLFTDLQNLVEGKTSKAEYLSSFCTSPSSAEEIADAKKIFKQCINMDLSSIIQLGKASELKNSLAIMLTSNAFADNMVDGTSKFLAEFDQTCERYESAKQDLSEAQEDEKEVDELMATLKQRIAEFIPLRNQAEAVDREIARLEKQVVERKAKKERLSKRLEDLAGQATTSIEALVGAEQRMKPSAIKKEQAEKAVDDIKKSWESLKFSCSVLR